MKLIIFTHAISRHPDDHPQFINELALAYQGKGHTVTILSASHCSIDRQRLDQRLNITLYRYAPKVLERLGYGASLDRDQTMRPLAWLLAPLLLFSGLFALRHMVKATRPAFVHAHWCLPNGVIAALALLGLDTKLLVSFPGSDVTVMGMNPVLRRLGLFACRRAHALTTNSHDLRDTVVGFGADPKKFHFVLYGASPVRSQITTADVGALRQQLGCGEDDKIVLAVGRLVPKKGFRYLIEAIGLLQDVPMPKTLIIGDGPERDVLQRLAADCGAASHIVFTGRVDFTKLPLYYALADIFASPSVREPVDGLNVVVIEAMKYALPIAASNVGGNELVVEHGSNGFLCAEKSAAAFADCLRRCLDAETDLSRLGRESERLFRERGCWNVIVDHYIRLLAESDVRP